MKLKNILFLFPIIFTLSCAPEKTENNSPVIIPKKTWTESERRFLLAELDRTTAELKKETENLGDDQWLFQEDEFRWSIAFIVEHLTVQNELHYREITALARVPEMPQYMVAAKGRDSLFQSYATAEEKRQAKWFLQPIGRFPSQRYSIDAFLRARDGLRDYVEATDADLRRHFSFRKGAAEKPIEELEPGDVRDLHQFILLGIAHTDRHLRQIRQVKKHPNYPKDI